MKHYADSFKLIALQKLYLNMGLMGLIIFYYTLKDMKFFAILLNIYTHAKY